MIVSEFFLPDDKKMTAAFCRSLKVVRSFQINGHITKKLETQEFCFHSCL